MSSRDDRLQEAGRRGGQSEATGARPPQARDAAEDEMACWVCGGPVVERHCKIVCRVCGFTRDCSDP